MQLCLVNLPPTNQNAITYVKCTMFTTWTMLFITSVYTRAASVYPTSQCDPYVHTHSLIARVNLSRNMALIFLYLSRHLQQHLSDEDFLIAFNMSRENFAGLTKWKKIELKKKANLF